MDPDQPASEISWLIRIYTDYHAAYEILHGLVLYDSDLFSTAKIASDSNFYLLLRNLLTFLCKLASADFDLCLA